MEKTEKENKETTEYKLVEVPTNYGIAIAKPDGNVLTTEQAIVELLNKVDNIEKALV